MVSPNLPEIVLISPFAANIVPAPKKNEPATKPNAAMILSLSLKLSNLRYRLGFCPSNDC